MWPPPAPQLPLLVANAIAAERLGGVNPPPPEPGGGPSLRGWKNTRPPAAPYPTAGSVIGTTSGTNPERLASQALASKAPSVGSTRASPQPPRAAAGHAHARTAAAAAEPVKRRTGP